MFEVLRYQRADGSEPFTEWLGSMRDKVGKVRIYSRLRQIEAGNWGDVSSVGSGISELRIHVGAGYRVYFGQHQKKLVIVLLGGDKSSQSEDVRRAKEYWLDWKRRQ